MEEEAHKSALEQIESILGELKTTHDADFEICTDTFLKTAVPISEEDKESVRTAEKRQKDVLQYLATRGAQSATDALEEKMLIEHFANLPLKSKKELLTSPEFSDRARKEVERKLKFINQLNGIVLQDIQQDESCLQRLKHAVPNKLELRIAGYKLVIEPV